MALPTPSPASSQKRNDRNSYWKLSDYLDIRMCDINEVRSNGLQAASGHWDSGGSLGRGEAPRVSPYVHITL